MFQWDKAVMTLDVPADKVVQLFRSMRDVQLALPGLPAQEASAYLCQHQTSQKIATTVAFHLLKSGQLAFYVETPREVAADKAAKMLDQAMTFIESMGFLMSDLDIQLLSAADREMLWSSLPLPQGVVGSGDQAGSAPARASAGKSGSATQSAAVLSPGVTAEQGLPASSPPSQADVESFVQQEAVAADPEASTVDDLLAAVEALRTHRAGSRMRRKAPGAEELQRRRRELTVNLGRILASL